MRSWKWFAPVGLVVVFAGLVPTVRDLSAGASPQADFVKTVVGTDFHSLDYRIAAQFVPNGGGAVYAHAIPDSTGNPLPLFLEANVDLPGGAIVTGVDVFYRECIEGEPFASHYFGSYNPSGSFAYHLQRRESPNTTCQISRLVRTLRAPLSVSTSRRYVVGVLVELGGIQGGSDPIDDPRFMITGARVRYTCPEACVP